VRGPRRPLPESLRTAAEKQTNLSEKLPDDLPENPGLSRAAARRSRTESHPERVESLLPDGARNRQGRPAAQHRASAENKADLPKIGENS